MSNMQKHFQLWLFTLLMIFVESQIHSVSSRADEASDYFKALQKPENRSLQKQSELKKNAINAKISEINKLNREDQKKVEEQMNRGSKDSEVDESTVATGATPAKKLNKRSENIGSSSSSSSSGSSSQPTQVKLDDYREDLGAPIVTPSTTPKTR